MMGRSIMWKKWWHWVVLAIHLLAILIFTKGFLLTRTELPYFSQCSDVSKSPCLHNSSNHCWTKPAVDRLIIVVLDALRFDFVAPSSFFPEKKPWMDKLSVLQKLAVTRGASARIFKAIADPPTTSLQRLKGLTTGGLPTFIDVGNSFGAPAIVEDNFIHQLVSNGKRVVMMGDDTWVQLFPDHFNNSYPYPSFNVKDLHTVDNGCIEHLFPALYEEDWDVLIAHFLGVDHAGHIYGVDSTSMIEKLEQYNSILEKLIKVLESQSGPGGLHENTFLLVMGDHGQTLNGDHGGGSPEEVETSIFAMNFKEPPSLLSELDSSVCENDQDENKFCVSSIEQLDFAATVSALLGIPFPFGSIGRVNPELYALAANTWNLESTNTKKDKKHSTMDEWLQTYANVLCINSWQVKRYIDIYSASSVIGFSSEDMLHISDIYTQAQKNWSYIAEKLLLHKHESHQTQLPDIKKQISAYFRFLSNVSALARSKWTEFNLKMMGAGLGIMLISLYILFLFIRRVNMCHSDPLPSSGYSGSYLELIFAITMVAIRACSFLSNSYILEEGKVASFLLATTGIIKLRYSIIKQKMVSEAVTFLFLISLLRFAIEVGLSKQAATSLFLSASPSWTLGFASGHQIWRYMVEIGPILGLIILAVLLCRFVISSGGVITKFVVAATISTYLLIAVQWISESNFSSLAPLLQRIGKSLIPRMVFASGLGQILLLIIGLLFSKKKGLDYRSILVTRTVMMLSALSSTIIILSGQQGSLIALASIIGGYCIMRLQLMGEDTVNTSPRIFTVNPLAVVQWNLLAVCLFFATGHWCAFDGLRYGAAFIGFDEFVLFRQAILLTIETFGFSLILPIFGLPLLVSSQNLSSQTVRSRNFISTQLRQAYMIYSLITATTVVATILCVFIQRRHLMVWGLFAPKFVFDVVALILTDVLICLALLYYSGGLENDAEHVESKEEELPEGSKKSIAVRWSRWN